MKKTSRSFEIVAAISLNGKIADRHGNFPSSSEDRLFLQKKIKDADALMMGRKTFEKHVKRVGKKPIIVFTRGINGIKTPSPAFTEVYLFHDKASDLIEFLDLMQFRKVLILGGAEIYHSVLKYRLVTDIFLTIEPILINGGKNFVSGPLFLEMKSWKLRKMKKLNASGAILLHYQP